MLEAFDSVVAGLRSAYLDLDTALVRSGKVRNVIRVQAADTAVDILAFAPVFREAHEAAVRLWEAETLLADARARAGAFPSWANLESAPLDPIPPISSRLKVAYKAMFLFVRAHQDSLYKVILELHGQTTGRASSMVDAAREPRVPTNSVNPARAFLLRSVPGYLEWFGSWRDRRNRVKLGVNFGLVGPASQLGINFCHVTADGGLVSELADVVRLPDVLKALEMSTRLSRQIKALAATADDAP
jgi:hypothetical protein